MVTDQVDSLTNIIQKLLDITGGSLAAAVKAKDDFDADKKRWAKYDAFLGDDKSNAAGATEQSNCGDDRGPNGGAVQCDGFDDDGFELGHCDCGGDCGCYVLSC